MKTGVDARTSPEASVTARTVAILASACFGAAVLWAGSAIEGYSQASQPVALLGARGVPHAGGFNLLGFIVPGLLLAGVSSALYLRLAASVGIGGRLGAWIAMFSTLAFAAQGVFPLEPEEGFGATSARLHVAAWCLWWLTSGVGGLLLAVGTCRTPRYRCWSGFFLAAGLLVPAFALFAPPAWGSAIPQRIAYVFWFAGWLLVADRLSRNAASVPGSSPPARG